jgi:integrase
MPTKRKDRKGREVWYGRITLTMPDGSTRRKEKSFPSKKDALAWEAKKAPVASHPGTTCGEWLDARIDDYAARGLESIDEKRLCFRRFFKDVSPATPVDKLTQKMCLAHLNGQAKTISGHRANRSKRHLVEAWSWGVEVLGLPPKNPFRSIKDYSEEKGVKYVPSETDFWKVYDHHQDQQIRLMLLLLYYTACRRTEVHRLTWGDVDLSGSKVRIGNRKGRNGSWRWYWISLPDDAVQALRLWKAKSTRKKDDDRVICNQANGEMIEDWHHLMGYLCEAAGVKPFGYHGIRHMVAVKLYRAGHAVSEIQQLLCHESPGTTEIYLRSLGVYQTTEKVVETLFVNKKVSQKVSQWAT